MLATSAFEPYVDPHICPEPPEFVSEPYVTEPYPGCLVEAWDGNVGELGVHSPMPGGADLWEVFINGDDGETTAGAYRYEVVIDTAGAPRLHLFKVTLGRELAMVGNGLWTGVPAPWDDLQSGIEKAEGDLTDAIQELDAAAEEVEEASGALVTGYAYNEEPARIKELNAHLQAAALRKREAEKALPAARDAVRDAKASHEEEKANHETRRERALARCPRRPYPYPFAA